MAKTVKLDPINQEVAIQTNDNLLSGLLQKDLNVWKECGGRGMCSTCHVFITEGMDSLSPVNRREMRTMEVITTANKFSRLACQARVIGEGVVVEIPSGMYVSEIENIEDLIGRRAEENILHPITGAVLVEAGKLVTRSMITQLKDTQVEVAEYIAKTQDG
ncbi:2Fe-2S iron-sulfur cluster-binding protein [Crocosphaera sp. UHCC 0190]|uniref:2Fe-2S iron-sulfur cluster-binding protein n=1 Tax=Crocosphaera sp. UHCC 0190 TaxID=3110246 RepID=UPI002B1F1804|nr:2Fe-2S iron-sulfur cluster-binding protein [Crocosphaera sp. UHCC 0190]MEA5510118.1 2Fe-2S iron-sulfur cluster-binding protein [Crocosphaera sp. UHCC 0190]